MFWDDLRKVLSRQTLYRFEDLIGARLVPVAFALGLASILIWAVSHIVAAFAVSFAEGIWGLIEILVYGALAVVLLRIGCELALVYFEAHGAAPATEARAGSGVNLLDDIGEALHELAEDDEEGIDLDADPAQFVGLDVSPGPQSADDSAVGAGARRRFRRRPSSPPVE